MNVGGVVWMLIQYAERQFIWFIEFGEEEYNKQETKKTLSVELKAETENLH